MEHQSSPNRSVLQCVFRAVARVPVRARRTGPLAILCLGVMVLGFVSLIEVFDTLAKPARPQSGGGCGPEFTVVDVPAAGTGMMQGSGGTGINANGDIVGVYSTAPSAGVLNLAHGFVRLASTGTITPFDAPNAGTGKNQGTFAVSINDGGVITGIYSDSGTAEHGFLRAADGTITEFDVPGAPVNVAHRGTSPTDINASGVITGMMEDTNTVRHGFLRAADGTFTSFDAPDAGSGLTQGTIPLRINAGGDVVGFYVDVNHVSHGFVRLSAGTFIAPIDAPGAGATGVSKGFKFGGTIAVGIDTAGDVTGIYADTNSIFHGYVRAANGTITTFDAPGVGTTGLFPGTAPTSMNAAGDIAGFYEDASGANHGFVRNFSTSTITAPLDAPHASASGMFNGTVPFGINASDDLAGVYIDANVVFHGFVLTLSSTTAPPTFSPAPGTYSSPQMVTISDVTAGATIYYTTDGSTPSTTSTQYKGTITVNTSETIKAIATASGCANSTVASATYTIAPPAATPTFSPAAGTYASVRMVTISDTTAGATIYYTTDGSTPSTTSTQYKGTITVNTTETLKAIAAAPGFANSAVGTATYTINLPTPDFQVSVSPSTLTIVAGQSGMATFTVTPQSGFNSKVSFACNGLPAEAACTFNPMSVTPNGAPISTMLTVTTTAASAALRLPFPTSLRLTYAFLFPGLAMIFGIAARRRPAPGGLQVLGLLLLLMLASGLSSCNGGSIGNPGTPIGTSTASVSAAAGGAGGPNHAANLTITITH
jgi:hypothetical protein